MREQDRTLECEHSIYGFHKQLNLDERTWNDELRAMSYNLGIAIVVLLSSGCEVRRLGCFSASKLEIAAARSPPTSIARAEICGSMIAVSVQPRQMQLTVIPPLSRQPTAAYSSARQPVTAELGCDVGRLVHRGYQSMHGRNVDHPSVAAFRHFR
jgi:hypothetical protein